MDSPQPGDTASLIAPGEPPPFSVFNGSGTARALVVCDHASPAIPAALEKLGVAEWVLEQHVAYDIGAAAVARVLAERLDAPAILSGYSRLIVDPNRRLEDATAFIEVSDGVAIPGNLELGEAEKRRRVACFREPYHGAIRARLDAFSAAGIPAALIAVHSCTPVFAQIVRRWHLGVMWDRDPRIARPLLEALSGLDGVCVGDNEPYSGRDPRDFTLHHHGVARGIPHVGIEVRQDLVADDAGARHWGGILADALAPIVASPELHGSP